MASDSEGERGSGARVIALGTWARSLGLVLGVVCLGAGVVAVYVSTNEAGTVGVLAVGLILVMVAIAGVLPRRIKVGDSEVELVAEGLSDLVDEVPPGNRAELAAILARLADVVPAAVARPLSAYVQMHAALDAVRRVLPPDAEVEVETGRHPVDAVITSPGRKVVVEVKAVPERAPASPRLVDGAVAQVTSYMERTAATGGLVVLAGESNRHALEAARRAGVPVVWWNGPADDEVLRSAIREVLTEPGG